MRTLLMTALLLTACAEAKPPATPAATDTPSPTASAPTASIEGVVGAERAFAQEATVRGWPEAYETWADDEGVVLQGKLANAKAFAANIHPDVRGDTSLTWAPEFAGVSAAGDFGFTAGPFNGDGAAFGHFLTVWRKTPAGDWRWLYEGGIDVLTPTAPASIASVTPAPPPAAADGDAAKANVEAAERELAAAAAADAAGALTARMASLARVQRENASPAMTPETIAALLAQGPAAVTFGNLSTQTSAAGDMAFTIGDASWDGGDGFYTRVWVRAADGWRIVFDQIVSK